MYKIYSVLLFILLPVFTFAASVTSDSTFNNDSLETEIRIYEVFGMDCPGCHGAVEKLVKKIPAVSGAQASWEKQEIKVWIDPGSEVKNEEIFDAIERANFTPGKRIEAPEDPGE